MNDATDELRRLLDERGMKWEDMSIFPLACTSWHDHDSEPCTALEGTDDIPDGKVSVQACVTLEQAIAATLGPGTCRNNAPTYLDFLCSECGFVHYHSDANDTKDGNGWGYCPNCGRRIVKAGE